jgi:hypothetical protein
MSADAPYRRGSGALGAPSGRALLDRIENDLLRVPGVMSASVVGEETPREIHVVATPERSPKQIVRDVQSLTSARFGISIDHRIVSVVQLGESKLHDQEPEGEEQARPLIDQVVFASKGNTGWVKVTLQWPNGEVTEGAEAAGVTRESRGRSAAMAVRRALDSWLAKRNAALDVEDVVIQHLGANDSITIRLVIHEEGGSTPLVGSALIYDDIATAAVHATMHALNRKFRLVLRI